MKYKAPKILLLDIETSPVLADIWDLWNQNIGLSQVQRDWFVLSWSAKWLGSKKIFQQDQQKAKRIDDDKDILKGIWKLMDEADVLVTQNGKKFDEKKLNARFILNGFKPPSSYKHVDTCEIAKRKFGFTSNKLEYLSKANKKYKKLKHKNFPGHDLWVECLKGNKSAWAEMRKYNKYDVLALEEVYLRFRPWDNSINYNLYTDSLEFVCACGNTKLHKNGYAYTSVGKFQRYSCSKCGAEVKDRENLFSKVKRKSLKVKGK